MKNLYFNLKDRKINILQSRIKKLEDENKCLEEQIRLYNVEKYKEKMKELTDYYNKYISLVKELEEYKSEYSKLTTNIKKEISNIRRTKV